MELVYSNPYYKPLNVSCVYIIFEFLTDELEQTKHKEFNWIVTWET